MNRAVMIIGFLLFISPMVHGANSVMRIELSMNAPMHFTIRVEDPPNLTELQGIVDEPRIRGIYEERLGMVFDSVENLVLSVESRVFLVDFDAQIAAAEDGVWVIRRRDFNDGIDSVSRLRIVLQDFELVGADPAPDRVSEDVLEWDNMDFVPEIRFKRVEKAPKEAGNDLRSLSGEEFAIGLILVIILAGGYLITRGIKK